MKNHQRVWAFAAGILATAVVLAPAAWAADSAALPVAVEPNSPQIRYVGRFDWRDAAGPRFEWSGCQIRFRFSGTAVNALLKDSASGGSHPAGGSRNNYFNVLIDGGEPKVLALEKGRTVYRLADGLADGEHTVTLFRRTEPLFGAVQFMGLQLEAGKSLKPLPPAPKRLIEFIGDSITCGYGNEGKDPKDPFRQQTENNYLAYGAITARSFGADYVCLAWSGQGVYRDRGEKTDNVLPVLYGRALPSDRVSKWDPNGYHPDVVVINLCTNDFAKSIPPKDEFLKAYRGLIATIRKHHGKDVHVFAAVGPMMYDGMPRGQGGGLTAIRGWLTEMAAEYDKAGDKKVHYFEFDRQDHANGLGSSYHPSLKTHRIMAAKLTGAITEKVGWKATGGRD
ncbi:MAG TPA: SGNH/GDSL hydrolase family protein [Phycisphaerae bacterium]|nr:SGNH/GDSL hydrolase family protein [Phycisphaerae bacterium]